MPSSPPSPALVLTSGRCMTVRALPPPLGMRTMLPVVRSETSAAPLGRKAIPQGTCRPVAMVLTAAAVVAVVVLATVCGLAPLAGCVSVEPQAARTVPAARSTAIERAMTSRMPRGSRNHARFLRLARGRAQPGRHRVGLAGEPARVGVLEQVELHLA